MFNINICRLELEGHKFILKTDHDPSRFEWEDWLEDIEKVIWDLGY